MSLIISFNGQFKPYTPTSIAESNKVKKLSLIAPTFNDLLHEYTSQQTIDEMVKSESHRQEIQNNKKSRELKAFTKNSKIEKKKYYAKDIMSTSVFSLSSSESISDAIQLMVAKQIHHIPIVDNGTMVGIVSDKLILKSMAMGNSEKTPLKKIMKEKVLTALEHSSISDIARAMLSEKISCLPVTNNKLQLKGILTTSDILSLLTLSFPLEIYA